jgi:hypothetical protein
MNTGRFIHRITVCFLLVTVVLLCLFPGEAPVRALENNSPKNENSLARVPSQEAGVPPGTPFQQSFKQTLAARAQRGLPVPSQVHYTVQVVEKGVQRQVITGRTVIIFDSPVQAGYEKWPAMVISEETAARAEIVGHDLVVPGNYDEAIRKVLANQVPGVWEQYEFGREPRTYIVEETLELLAPINGEAFPGLESVVVQNSPVAQQILFGETELGPNIRYGIFLEWKEFGQTLAKFYLGFLLDWAIGLRLPVEVTINSPTEMVQGSTYSINASINPLDWSADDYQRVGVPPENGNEYILRFEFFAGIHIQIAGHDVYKKSRELGFDASRSFKTPFGPGSVFELYEEYVPSSRTGLFWGEEDLFTVGIGLLLKPAFEGPSRITADWRAGKDARGGGQLNFTDASPVSLGPVEAGDFSASDTARLWLERFRYWFNPDSAQINVSGTIDYSFKLFGLVSESHAGDFPVGAIRFFDPGEGTDLGIQPGTGELAQAEIKVVTPLRVVKSVEPAFVQAGGTATIHTTVNNLGDSRLDNVTVSDTTCPVENIGTLNPHQSITYDCLLTASADTRSAATATATGLSGELFSDNALVLIYVLDGVVGDGTPESCTEEALDAELFQYSGSVITFKCGPGPHTIDLTQMKVISRSLELTGSGLIALNGQQLVRVFEVPANLSLTLRGFTIANGWAHRSNGAPNAEGGGGIHNFGELTLEECTLLNNSADYGGGIHNEHSGKLTILRSTLVGNQAIDIGGCGEACTDVGGDGGGLYNAGMASVGASQFRNNTAHGGGAIINWESGQLIIWENTILEYNSARNGGAVENGDSGQVEIRNARLANNTARFIGGALANYEGGKVSIIQSTLRANQSIHVENPEFPTGGGAIFNHPGGNVSLEGSQITGNRSHYGAGAHNMGSMTISQSTFTGNYAIHDGGGAYNEGSMSVSSSTFGGSGPDDLNQAIGGGALINWSPSGQLTISDSTLLGNQADNGGALENGDGGKLVVLQTQLLNNTARFIGGGVVNYDTGQVELRASALTGNKGGDGGGLHNYGSGAILIADGTVLSSNFAGNKGGGIYNQSGSLTLNAGTLRENQAGDVLPDGDYFIGSGGGIYNESGSVTLRDCDLSDNAASGLPAGGTAGGGIYNGSGEITLTLCTLKGNRALGGAYGSGGGIYNDNGFISLIDTTIQNNLAEGRYIAGSGLYNRNRMIINRSTIHDNSYLIAYLGEGGAVYNEGTLSLINSTVSGNNFGAGVTAGGMYNAGELTITTSTVVDNHAYAVGGIYGSVTLKNTIIANNTSSSFPDGNCLGSITSNGYNLSSGISCGLNGTGDLSNTNPLLGPLADNGGPTWTYALLPDSPAIGQIPREQCAVTTDQRGVNRPQGAFCDIGSYEREVVIVNRALRLTNMWFSYNPTPLPNAPAGVFTIFSTFRNVSTRAIRDMTFKVAVLTGGNLLLNADGEPGGVGATISVPPAALGANRLLDPGERFTMVFRIGLQRQQLFIFLANAYGIPAGGMMSAQESGGEGFQFDIQDEQLEDKTNLYLPVLSK